MSYCMKAKFLHEFLHELLREFLHEFLHELLRESYCCCYWIFEWKKSYEVLKSATLSRSIAPYFNFAYAISVVNIGGYKTLRSLLLVCMLS